jgi:hypothetical protein
MVATSPSRTSVVSVSRATTTPKIVCTAEIPSTVRPIHLMSSILACARERTLWNKATGDLPFEALPVWEEPGGFRLAQSVAIANYLDRKLRANQGGAGFAVGADVTVADLALWYLLEMIRDNGFGEPLDRYPALVAFARRIAGRPRIAAWIASPRRRPFTPLPS